MVGRRQQHRFTILYISVPLLMRGIHFTHASVPIDTLNEEWHSAFSTRVLLIGLSRPADPGNQCGNNKCPQASPTLARIPSQYASQELLQPYVYWDFAAVRQLSLPIFLASHRSVVRPVPSYPVFSRALDLGKLMGAIIADLSFSGQPAKLTTHRQASVYFT